MKNIKEQILSLKKSNDAVIMAHYYVSPEVKEVADHLGDSYYLSKTAMDVKEKNIVLCGVKFMGESVKILNPEKNVIMPNNDADCPMAHMVAENTILEARNKYDDLAVVCYINSTANIKALSDVCVTSSNAKKIISRMDNKNILFVPDRNLASYLAPFFPEKNFIYNEGFCYVHDEITREKVLDIKKEFQEAEILVHPECRKEVVSIGDYVGSTSGIIEYASKSAGEVFIICTEEGINNEVQSKNPDKKFIYPKERPICKDMKKVTLEDVLFALNSINQGQNIINLDRDIIESAKKPLELMHELAE